MATTRKRSAGKRTTRRASARRKTSPSRRRGSGSNKAVDRAGASIDASQKALRDLRDELRKGGSTLLKDAQLRDAEKLVKDAGTSFRSLSKRRLKDLDNVATSARTGRKTTKRKATKRKATKRRDSTPSNSSGCVTGS